MMTTAAKHWNVRSALKELSFAPSFLVYEQVSSLRQQGRTVYHMAYDQPPFPVHSIIQESFSKQIARIAYLPSVGFLELCTLARHYFIPRLGMDEQNYQVIIDNNTQELIRDVQLAVEGDLLLPVPALMGHVPKDCVSHDKLHKIKLSMENGYCLTADLLEESIKTVIAKGNKPRKILLSYPNNPTGITYTPQQLAGIAEVARRYNILIISNEVFGLVNYKNNHVSISRYYPEGTIVIAGLSRHLSLGGFELGVALFPENMEHIFQGVRCIASEKFSFAATPLQYSILAALQGNAELEEYINICTHIHSIVSRYMCRKLRKIGIAYPAVEGSFFLYPDFSQFKTILEQKYGVSGSAALAESLLLERQIATLPGTAFGDSSEQLTLRISATDYNGKAALEYYEKFGLVSEDNFIEACCPRIEEGMRRLGQYFLG